MARGTNRKLLLNKHRFCIYCGGNEAASTVDHMPNKAMFPKGTRPAGLEFPCCEGCNQGSKEDEAITSFLGAIRMESSPQSSTQFERHLAHIVNNYPAARFAIVPTQSQKIRAAGFVDKNGEEYGALNVEAPYIQKRVRRYGAKMALALHWQERRKPLPSQGKVAVLWFTNAQAIERSVPQHLLDLLPDRKTLRQGQKEVGDWFEYSSGPASDTDATAHWAAFGDALLFMMFAGTTLDFGPVDPSELFSPGFLRE